MATRGVLVIEIVYYRFLLSNLDCQLRKELQGNKRIVAKEADHAALQQGGIPSV